MLLRFLTFVSLLALVTSQVAPVVIPVSQIAAKSTIATAKSTPPVLSNGLYLKQENISDNKTIILKCVETIYFDILDICLFNSYCTFFLNASYLPVM